MEFILLLTIICLPLLALQIWGLITYACDEISAAWGRALAGLRAFTTTKGL